MIITLKSCVAPKVVNTKIADILSGIDHPDQSRKAGCSFTNTHESDQFTWMDSKLRIVEYHKRNYNRAAN